MSYLEDTFTPEDICAPAREPEKRENTLTELLKSLRNNHCTIKMRFGRKWKGQYLKNVQFSYYKASLNPGSQIIHAVTGDYLPGQVGSLAENQYYKVKMACFGSEQNGTLFYLSPDEYANHQYCEVSDESRQRWIANRS